ncbi:MAG: hypothetical protein ACRD2X_19865 [Vicinamibacteraceae bacterium]
MRSSARMIDVLWVLGLTSSMAVLSAAAQDVAQPQTAQPQTAQPPTGGQSPQQAPPQQQQQPQQAAEPDKAIIEQVKPLYALVDEAMKSGGASDASAWNVDPSGKQPPSAATPPSKPTLATDFVGFPDRQVYVPFQLQLDAQTLPSPAVAVYVRAVAKSAAGAAKASGASAQEEDPKQEESDEPSAKEPAETKFPFEDFYVGTTKQVGPNEPSVLSGYALLPTGAYDLYVALRERATDASKPFQAIVVKAALDVPNYGGGELTTSSVLLAKKMEELPKEPTPDERHENPYTLGRARLIMASDGVFAQGDEFNLVMFVYNFGTDQNKKPDVTVEYQLFEKSGEAEKEFVKLEPQTYDASTVDSTDDRLAVSLSFAMSDLKKQGEFRLVIKVTDNTSGKSLTRDAPFTVAAS